MTVVVVLVMFWAVAVLVIDLTARRIPNLLSVGAALLAVAFLVISGKAVLGADWQSALLGAVLGLCLTLPGYLMRWLGAGDVKLLLAIGLLGGWQAVFASFAVAGLSAGAVVATRLALARYWGYPMPTGRWLPLGAALALGFLVAIGSGA